MVPLVALIRLQKQSVSNWKPLWKMYKVPLINFVEGSCQLDYIMMSMKWYSLLNYVIYLFFSCNKSYCRQYQIPDFNPVFALNYSCQGNGESWILPPYKIWNTESKILIYQAMLKSTLTLLIIY